MGYFDAIQAFFTEKTGRGVMIGGRDLELLNRWRGQGATVELICQGIHQAIESLPDDDPPRSVWACRAWIEPELERARDKAVGAHADDEPTRPDGRRAGSPRDGDGRDDTYDPSDPCQQAMHRVERAGRACDRDRLRQAYREAWRRLRDLVDAAPDDRFEQLAAIEDALVDAFFDGLDEAEQAAIDARIAEDSRSHLSRMSADARRQHLVARRRRILVEEHGLVSLIE